MSDYSSNYNNSALQKARQVAAKLQIAGPGANKRSLEDTDDNDSPHSKRFSGGSDWSNNSTMSPAHLQQAQQVAAQVAARLGQQQQHSNQYQQNPAMPNPEAVQKAKELISKFVPQTATGVGSGGMPPAAPASSGGPTRVGLGAQNYTEIMVPGSKVGLIIGKGGETIKQLQERTGAKMVVIQDGPGQEMEKPLRISGEPQKVEHAKQLVYDLINDKGGEGPQNSRGPGSSGNYGGNRNPERNMGSSGGGYSSGGDDQMEIFVPKIAVGVVIGKGGDMIKKIQAETGCRLQFLQTKNDGPGDRRCIVQGTKQQVDDGKRMIEDLIESVMRRNGEQHWNGGSGSNSSSGYNQHQQSQPMGAGSGVQVQQEQYQFVVPASKCGIIIGRGGDTIKQINQQSGAHCEMDRKISANQTVEKTFTIKGEQHQVDEAKRQIQDKINMDITLVHIGSTTVTQQANGYGQNAQNYQSWGYGGGAAAQGWDQSQAPAGGPAGQGQPDYSQQWIEYYRSMGMHREAEAIEQQVKAKQSTGGGMPQQSMMPGAAAAQPTNGSATSAPGQSQSSQQDYSQEWANYYRQMGKIEEAEAIEKQIATSKTPQPSMGGQAGGAQNMAAYQYQQQQQQQQQQYGQFGAPNAAGYPGQYQQYQGGYPGQQSGGNDKNW